MTAQQLRRIPTGAILSSVVTAFLFGAPLAAAEPPPVTHPNLLLNRDEIDQVKAKIKQHDWAARLLDRVRQLADSSGHTEKNPRDAALVYVLTGEPRYAAAVRRALLGTARRLRAGTGEARYPRKSARSSTPSTLAAGAPSAWAYDLTYDTFSADERREVEQLFRAAARTIIASLKAVPTTPNLVFELHYKVAIIGYCLGDRELIEWGMNDPGQHGPGLGGFYQVLDVNMRDGYFWGEAPIYAMTGTVPGMLALAEAALHYDGTDLYRYVSRKSGGSIKNLIDGYLRLAYRAGADRDRRRLAAAGDLRGRLDLDQHARRALRHVPDQSRAPGQRRQDTRHAQRRIGDRLQALPGPRLRLAAEPEPEAQRLHRLWQSHDLGPRRPDARRAAAGKAHTAGRAGGSLSAAGGGCAALR